MNRQELQAAFQKPYQRDEWLGVLHSVLPGTEIFAGPQPVGIGHKIARRVVQLGRVRLAGERQLAILEIEVADRIDIVRNRVGLRNFVARFIDQERAHGVLAVFRFPGKDYRFTFVARESTLTEAGTLVTKETATRRFTYVLGPNEPCRTPAQRFAALAAKGQEAALEDVTDAFSVEKLNREFFDTYKQHYQKFCAHLLDSDLPARAFGIKLKGLDDKARDRALKPVRDFVKKLLGRLVFLHFLQKKGWLGCPASPSPGGEGAVPRLRERERVAAGRVRDDGEKLSDAGEGGRWRNGDPNFLKNLFATAPAAEQRRFHSRRLVPLFFDTLNRQRQGDLFSITGTRVPYLNGGLFERDFDRVEAIDFPVALFRDLLEFFGQYNFTIDENDPDDREIGIDPEMLGHIFENLLEDNKDKGAYYTPKAIVQYMCQQSLIYALAGHFVDAQTLTPALSLSEREREKRSPRPVQANASMGTDAAYISRFELKTPTTPLPALSSPSEGEERVAAGRERSGRGEVQGEGGRFATARAAIERLIRLKEPIDPKRDSWLAAHATELERHLDALRICDPAIGSGAFPIGLLQEIYWTKLTLHPALDRAKAKRDIIQHSIYGVDLDAGAVEIARLRFWLALIVDEPEPLPLPNLDYQIMQGNSLLESFEGLDLSKIAQPQTVGITLLGSDQSELGFSAQQVEIADASPLREDLAALQQKYFLLHHPEAKAELRHRIDLLVLRTIDEDLERRREQLQASLDNWHRELARKKKAKKDYEPSSKESKARDRMQVEIEELAAKKVKLHALLEDPRAARPFFLWHLWFKHILSPPPRGRGGFDIVIGNPPYVRADNPDIAEQRQAILASGNYHTLWEKWDLFIPFIEHGYRLLRPGGVESMIVSDAYCHAKYAIKSQDWFLKNAIVRRLDFLGKLQIFDAGVKNMIFFYERGDGVANLPERRLHTERFGNLKQLPSELQVEATHRLFAPDGEAGDFSSAQTITLDQICYATVGMVVNAHEKLAPGAFDMEDLLSPVKDKTHPKAFVEGKDLDSWLPARNSWLEWGTERAPKLFRRPTFPELYEVPEKILVQRSPGPDPKACFDNQHLHYTESSVGFILWNHLKGVKNNSLKKVARYVGEKPIRLDLPKREELEATSQKFEVKYLLAVLNSSVAHKFLGARRRSNIHIYPDDWKCLPIPVATAEQQQPIIEVTSLIISILGYFSRHPQTRTARDELLISFLEALNDALVAQLYYPEQFRAKGLDAAKLVVEARLPNPKKIPDAKAMDAVRAALETAYDIKHPLRALVYDFGSMELAATEAVQ